MGTKAAAVPRSEAGGKRGGTNQEFILGSCIWLNPLASEGAIPVWSCSAGAGAVCGRHKLWLRGGRAQGSWKGWARASK